MEILCIAANGLIMLSVAQTRYMASKWYDEW